MTDGNDGKRGELLYHMEEMLRAAEDQDVPSIVRMSVRMMKKGAEDLRKVGVVPIAPMVAVDPSKARAELESEHLRLREETARSLQTLKGELEERAQRLAQDLSALQQERQELAEQKTMLDAMLENIQQEAQALDAKKEKAQAAPLIGVSASTPSPEELQRLAASEQKCKELLEKLRASEARLAGRESEFKELSGKLEAEARKVSQLQQDSSLDEDLLREVDRLENENRALAERLNRPWQEVLKEASSQWAT